MRRRIDTGNPAHCCQSDTQYHWSVLLVSYFYVLIAFLCFFSFFICGVILHNTRITRIIHVLRLFDYYFFKIFFLNWHPALWHSYLVWFTYNGKTIVRNLTVYMTLTCILSKCFIACTSGLMYHVVSPYLLPLTSMFVAQQCLRARLQEGKLLIL